MGKFKGKYNSLEHALHIQSEHEEYEKGSVFDDLEQDWQCLISNRENKYPEQICIENEFNKNCLTTIVGMIRSGECPPPELMIALVETYDMYIEKHGNISLEEAFFGRSKQNRGNFSANEFKQQKYESLDLMVTLEKLFTALGSTKKSKIKIVEEFIKENDLPDEPEHLLRMYYRNSDK